MAATIDDILRSHETGRPVLMGVLNVTPDSFSDGGRFLRSQDAITQARRMLAEGADIIDIGAESTRPGSDPANPDEQIARLKEILPAVASEATVSIDTTIAAVASFALQCGAAIINDTSAGQDDEEMFPLAARVRLPIVLMHRPVPPRTMQDDPRYANVVAEVKEFLSARMELAVKAGVKRERIILDPGIGFGKRLEDNLVLLAGVGELVKLGRPVLIGASRKKFIGLLSGADDPMQRLGGTIAAHLAAWARGATIFRVHEVGTMRQALIVAEAIGKAINSAEKNCDSGNLRLNINHKPRRCN